MTTLLRRVGALFLVTFAAIAIGTTRPSAQQTATSAPTGLILGQTVDGTSGKAIGGTIVTLNYTPAPLGTWGDAREPGGGWSQQWTRAPGDRQHRTLPLP